MQETMPAAEYNKLYNKKQKKPAKRQLLPVQATQPVQEPSETTQKSRLAKRLDKVLKPYGWECEEYRAFCLDERSPENTAETTAKNNAVVIWRIGNEPYASRVLHLGWLWDVQEWTDEQVLMRVQEIEKEAA